MTEQTPGPRPHITEQKSATDLAADAPRCRCSFCKSWVTIPPYRDVDDMPYCSTECRRDAMLYEIADVLTGFSGGSYNTARSRTFESERRKRRRGR